MIDLPLIWKTHKHREMYGGKCPHCGKEIIWKYHTSGWLPCDREPVLFILHPKGKQPVYYKKELYENGLLYRPGDSRVSGEPLTGHIQHWYTCPVLIQRRKEYMRARNHK